MPNDKTGGVLHAVSANVGDIAPAFALPALIGGVRGNFALRDHRAKNIVLAFYPFNWQDATIQQMSGYQAQRERLGVSNAEVVGITVESIMNTTAWERHYGPFDFPLCSDFWPHGEVSARYGVLRETGNGAGACERAILIVNVDGHVVFRKIYGWDEAPPITDVFEALVRL